ncbi:hypothetical protein TrVE_jg7073 [Triparma verrucosa]|uniref:tRNA (guanine(46)-N(7))-methyltransferase n=1 Tax=Triparma verrucosa TaxID=1606542 RepID=A0A9W7FDL3_9STRA|nr:hypothetical protein TrVE_jg7073 [Triparma verrucosa]
MTDYDLTKPKWFQQKLRQISKGQKKELQRLSPLYLIPQLPYNTPLPLSSTFPTSPSSPLILEIGSGTGTTLLSLSKAFPNHNIIGVEIHKASLAITAQTLHSNSTKNVKLYGGDAVKFLNRNIQPNSLEMVLVLFPDPWEDDGTMNKQHRDGEYDRADVASSEKDEPAINHESPTEGVPSSTRRIICPSVLTLLHTRLKPLGTLQISTDVDSYSHHITSLMSSLSEFWTGGECERKNWRVKTKYEERGEGFGHLVKNWEYTKTPEKAPTVTTSSSPPPMSSLSPPTSSSPPPPPSSIEDLKSHLRTLKIKDLKHLLTSNSVPYSPHAMIEKSDFINLIISSNIDPHDPPVPVKPRECKCMFCHETFIFRDESEAMKHMEVCKGLERQLGNEQHTFDVNS